MSLRLMSLLGGGFNFFFNFHPYFSNGLVKPPTRLVFSLPSTNPAFQQQKTPRRGETSSLVTLLLSKLRFGWTPLLAACSKGRHLFQKQTAVGVFLLLLLVGKATVLILFLLVGAFFVFCFCCLFFFVVFFSLVGKAKQKHQNVQPSGNIYCSFHIGDVILPIYIRGALAVVFFVGYCFLSFFLGGFFFGESWGKCCFFLKVRKRFQLNTGNARTRKTMGIQMANKTQKAERVQV